MIGTDVGYKRHQSQKSEGGLELRHNIVKVIGLSRKNIAILWRYELAFGAVI